MGCERRRIILMIRTKLCFPDPSRSLCARYISRPLRRVPAGEGLEKYARPTRALTTPRPRFEFRAPSMDGALCLTGGPSKEDDVQNTTKGAVKRWASTSKLASSADPLDHLLHCGCWT